MSKILQRYAGISFLSIISLISRFTMLGHIPGGVNADEAFSGWLAHSLIYSGTDNFGYSFPVYFSAWGSGMNALNTYLIMPFIYFLGNSTLAIRLPQALLACISVMFFYLILKNIFDNKYAIFGGLFLAINPWHIMMSRWGLESNLVVAFLIMGIYFFILGLDKDKFFILSALAFGFSLYCYATIWPILPFIIFSFGIYSFYVKKLKLNICLIGAVIVLALMSMPLMAFLLVNYGLVDEFSVGALSIPRLVDIRSSDITVWNIPANAAKLIKMLVTQNDGLLWNSPGIFGFYYKGMILAAFVGTIVSAKEAIKSIRVKEYNKEIFILIWLVFSLILGCLIDVNVNRINCIHIPIIYFAIKGIYEMWRVIKWRKAFVIILGSYLAASFILFEIFYFTSYKKAIAYEFNDGISEAVEYANSNLKANTINVSKSIKYPQIMFVEGTDATEYRKTVKYNNYPAKFLEVESFGKYYFFTGEKYDDGVYIIHTTQSEKYISHSFKVKTFKDIAVAFK